MSSTHSSLTQAYSDLLRFAPPGPLFLFQIRRGQYQAILRRYDVFVSHATKDGLGVFEKLQGYMDGRNLTVFNPTTILSHVERPSTGAMQAYARTSKLVLAVLTDGFFESKWCEAEIRAAMDVGLKVVPVFSGDDYTGRNVDAWVAAYKAHEVYGYVFKQNAMDVKNKFNASQVKSTLDKLIEVHLPR